MLGAFLLALAPGWLGVLVALQVVFHGGLMDQALRLRLPEPRAFVPDFDDTGEDSVPFVPNFDDTGSQPRSRSPRIRSRRTSPEPTVQSVAAAGHRARPVPVREVVEAAAGDPRACGSLRPRSDSSLFYWWYHANDKTAAVYMVLVYVVVCVVAAVIMAMVQGRPMISALAHRGDVGAVCVRCRGGAALRPLLLRAGGPLPRRRHSLLTARRPRLGHRPLG